MIIKRGQAKIIRTMGADSTKTRIFNIVEKTDGAYTETLTELVDMKVLYNDGTGEYVMDSASELGMGYKVYPCISATEQMVAFMETTSDVVEWIVPLTEVVE